MEPFIPQTPEKELESLFISNRSLEEHQDPDRTQNIFENEIFENQGVQYPPNHACETAEKT